MAVTLTTSELLSALRMGSTPEETQEATRLLSYATTAIEKYLGDAYEDTPEAVVNEASIRWTGYLFDMPFASRGTAFSSAITNSGAGAILLPYRVHAAGNVAEATAAAQEAIGSTGNPVTDVQVAGSSMTVTFADGTTRTEALPAGMGGGPGEDATARASAATAQTRADDAQAEIDAHEATPHNTDITARDAAAAAQMAAAAGGRPRVLYEASTVAIGGNTTLVSGNVVCPETGDLEFYFEGLTGSRRGGVAYARIPAERIRGAVSELAVAYSNDTPDILAIAHGANRGVGVSVQENTNYMMLSAQAPGNYYTRISYIA